MQVLAEVANYQLHSYHQTFLELYAQEVKVQILKRNYLVLGNDCP